MLSSIINSQNVSIIFAIIIVSSQEHYEYNKLPNGIGGIIQHYNRCLNSQYFVHVHLFVWLHNFKYSCNEQIWNIEKFVNDLVVIDGLSLSLQVS